MNLCIYLSMYLCIYLSVCVSSYLSVYVFMYLSVYLSMYLCIYLSICLCIYASIFLSVYVAAAAARHFTHSMIQLRVAKVQHARVADMTSQLKLYIIPQSGYILTWLFTICLKKTLNPSHNWQSFSQSFAPFLHHHRRRRRRRHHHLHHHHHHHTIIIIILTLKVAGMKMDN